jgi:hypothetical protein
MTFKYYSPFTLPNNAYKHKNFVYIPNYKNGSTAFSQFFVKHGWEEINVFEETFDKNTVLFGHITDPMQRHTKGVAEFLIQHKLEGLVDVEPYNILLAESMFDEHTIPLKFYLGELFDKIQWIPLDYKFNQYDGTFLTNRFFKKHGLDLQFSSEDITYTADDSKKILYQKIAALKDKHLDFSNLSKKHSPAFFFFFVHDLEKYAEVVDTINQINLDID